MKHQIHRAKAPLILLLCLGSILAVTACKSTSEHPGNASQPAGSQTPAPTEHPTSEHPTSEHPK